MLRPITTWGNVLKALGRFKEALLDYGEAILLKPDYFEAYNNKGILLREIGHFEEATSDYNKAISLRPNSETAYTQLEVMCLES